MGKTLKRSYIPMDWIIINEEWWQRVFSIEAMGILNKGTMMSHEIETMYPLG